MESENYKDRSGGLVAFGILQIIGGVICLLFAGVCCLPVFIAGAGVPFRQVAGGMMVYVFMAVWLVWMGIGTVMAKRWAQTLMLAGAWFALLCGITALSVVGFLFPKMIPQMEIPAEMAKIMLIFMFAFMFVIYLLFPTIGILFYGGRNVRATCRARHPEISWPERCPLPVLILAMMMALATVSVVTMWPMNFALPFFGRFVSGGAGLAVLLLGSAISMVLAVGVYQVRSSAWWGVLAMLVVMTISQFITFSRVDVMDIYKGMDFPQQTLDQMENWASGPLFMGVGVVYVVIALVYLLWVRKYFVIEEKGEIHE
ncbi:MAG: hypothetical protein K9M45_05535 [Kiritimatiellales bacterium]|nr:hypothetical protein [Kiritimatiellales bacterium]